MVDDGQIIWESDFKIIDKDELENMKNQWELTTDDESKIQNIESKNKDHWNLKDDLIELWFLDYDNLSEEEKIIFDEMKDEKRDNFYELD